jgi:hypothetical protein
MVRRRDRDDLRARSTRCRSSPARTT